jgi:hypothetical protein
MNTGSDQSNLVQQILAKTEEKQVKDRSMTDSIVVRAGSVSAWNESMYKRLVTLTGHSSSYAHDTTTWFEDVLFHV